MPIIDKIQEQVKEAAKAQDKKTLATLRLLIDGLKKEAKSQQVESLDEPGEIAVLKRERKRRIEAAEAFEGGGRKEQAAAERAEAELIDAYLPEQMGEERIREIVVAAVEQSGASGPGDIGKVMPLVMKQVAGQADGRRVNEIVREQLAPTD